ncbi:AAA family ATPase [Pseudomonas sp. UL070]|uniref:AAA family ATPase n=2 Tax=Aquipseudomonas ullengensis TaxID=2759166 RepID=A0A7W4LPA0_9GAMM|nr:AAA family ATPase [Pseudomonas ullengensis]
MPPVSSLWRAELISAASIVPIPILWLWPSWIARGKLTVLAGAGGSGKSTLAITFAAIVTRGGRWPDDTSCNAPGNVLIWSSEDDPADTLIPRLKAAGADLERVRIIKGRFNDLGGHEAFDPATDIDLLYQEMDSTGGAALLVIDPVVCAVKGDMHRANDVRRSLQPLVDFAEAHQCAVLGISHFSKNTTGSLPADRVLGSQAFSAFARTVLVAAKPEDSDGRILARAKSNISDDQGGISYQIELCTIDAGIEAVRVVWGEHIEGSAREILASVEGFAGEEPSAQKDAEQFLVSLLSAGPVPVEQIKAYAKSAGHAWRTVERAKKKLGAEAYKQGKGSWFWRLGIEERQTTPKAATKNSDGLQAGMTAFGSNTFDESDSEAF